MDSSAEDDVHSSVDSPPVDDSAVPVTSTGAFSMGGNSLVTLLAQMQVSTSTIASDAATTVMAVVATDRTSRNNALSSWGAST